MADLDKRKRWQFGMLTLLLVMGGICVVAALLYWLNQLPAEFEIEIPSF